MLSKLLSKNLAKRFSSMSEVREHPWFKNLKWSEIQKRSSKAPIIPRNILRAKFLERNPNRKNPEEKEYMANPHFFIK